MAEGERAGGAQRRSLASAWAQRSLPGDSCPLSVPLAHPWSPRPPQCFLRPAEHHGEQHLPPGKEQHLQRARQLTSLADRGGLGETRCFKGIFVQSSCSGLWRSPLGGRFVVYIDSCTISQPLPPPQTPHLARLISGCTVTCEPCTNG